MRMKMKKTASTALSIMTLFAAAVATSCSNDSADDSGHSSGGGQTVEFTVSLDDDNSTITRVGMAKENGDTISYYWHTGDSIFVQTKSGDFYSGTKFTTSAETGSTTASFTGTIAPGSTMDTYAVYPYNENHRFTSATSLTFNMPAAYTYNKVDSNIFAKTVDASTVYPENSINIPLIGDIVKDEVDFIGGLAVIRIDKMPTDSGTLVVTADQQLSGDFTIGDLTADGAALVTSTSVATADDKKVTFTFSGATTGGAGVFYLPLATGSYSSLKIGITYGTTTQTVVYGNLTVTLGKVAEIPISTDSKGNLRYIVENEDGTYTINGHTFLDLGLSMLWAATSIGASGPYDNGKYYAWGETSTKEYYTEGNYRYDRGKTTLSAENDAATVNWGSACRMPTTGDFGELMDNCDWTWEERVNSSSYFIWCYKGVSKKNNKVIYLPASGSYSSEYYIYYVQNRNSKGYYWSSTGDDATWSFSLFFDRYAGNQYAVGYNPATYWRRHYACPIRPVAEKP